MKETLTILRLLAKLLVQMPGKMIKKVRTSARKPKGGADEGAGYVNLYRADDGTLSFGSCDPYGSKLAAVTYHLPELRKAGKVYIYWTTVKISFR